jgi:hypothetical protein
MNSIIITETVSANWIELAGSVNTAGLVDDLNYL